MCLSIAIDRPDDVLAKGEHAGFEWMVIHNGMGYRCGYVKVEPGHPWHGKDDTDSFADVHGGVTFGAGDVDCGKGGADSGWWIGFDCAHFGDAPDRSLPIREPGSFGHAGVVRTQEYVEAECRSLCEQARNVV